MSSIKQNVLSAIGNTPMVRLNKIAQGLDAGIFMKLEYFNPTGATRIEWPLVRLSPLLERVHDLNASRIFKSRL